MMARSGSETSAIRRLRVGELDRMLAIINAAAEAYRGRIPDDCWHQPYMPEEELRSEIGSGVLFHGIDDAGALVALMGVQQVRDVQLIRHAYVLPRCQGQGLGGRLVERICGLLPGQMLVGTWAAAGWAIRFYEGHGFSLLPSAVTPAVLRAYWRIPERQVATSVVLARPALDEEQARALAGSAAQGQR